MVTEAAFQRLQRAAAELETELRRVRPSEPLIFRASRDLDAELERYLRRKEAMEWCGEVSESSPATRELIRECHVMIECATLIIYG